MNKVGIVLGVALVATLSGCKDPKAQTNISSQSNSVDITTDSVPAKSSEVVVAEPKQTVTADLSTPAPAPEPEYTIYIVQKGDYLAKISKKFNVTISSIKRLNPSIKKDVVRLGQKLKLPGKLEVGEQTVPAEAKAVKTPKKSFTPYEGATKEYVVKNGDTLGAIAYGNGITIRQLKVLNSLTSDSLKIGQKLKIPAEKVAKANSAPVAKKVETEVKKDEAEAVKADVEATVSEDVAAVAIAPAVEEKATSAVESPNTYVVSEGEDIFGVAVRWGVSAAQIREINNLSETDQLVPGQVIKLPAEAQQ